MKIGKFDFDFEHDDMIATIAFYILAVVGLILLLTFSIWLLGPFWGLNAVFLAIGISFLIIAARIRYNQKKERGEY